MEVGGRGSVTFGCPTPDYLHYVVPSFGIVLAAALRSFFEVNLFSWKC